MRAHGFLRTKGLALMAATAATVAAFQQSPVVDADALRVISVKEVVRAGSVDDAKRAFNAILAVDVDRDGQIYVYESKDNEIRVLTRDGQPLRTIGRKGSGPGEFTLVSSFGVLGDTVWAIEELQNGRLHLFRRSGVLISSSQSEHVDVPLHSGTLAVLYPQTMRTDGRFISHVAFALQRATTGVGAADTVMVPRLRFTLSGRVIDTVGREPVPPPDSPAFPSPGGAGPVVVDGVSYVVPRPPTDAFIRTALTDGSAIVTRLRATGAQPSEFQLVRFDLAGKPLHRLRFRYRPSRYAGAVLDTIAMRPVSAKQGGDAAFKAVRAAMVYPPFASPVYAVFAAADGALWLRREDNAGPYMRWVVIERSGAVRGVVQIPRSARPAWARADTLLAIDTDELGVPFVVRYQLSPARGRLP